MFCKLSRVDCGSPEVMHRSSGKARYICAGLSVKSWKLKELNIIWNRPFLGASFIIGQYEGTNLKE